MTWANQLQNDWSWVSGLGYIPTNSVWQTIHQNMNPVLNYLQQAQNSRAQNDLQNAEAYLNAAVSQLEQFFRQFPWLLPNSSQRLFLEEIRDKVHKLEAGLIAAYWMKIDVSNAPVQHIVNAILKQEFFERGIKDRIKNESAVLKRLAGDMQTQATKFQEAEQTQTNRFDSLHSDITKQTGEQQQAFDEAQQQRMNTWEQQLNTTKQELENIRNAYDQHMAIAAPIEYWEKKRIKHRNLYFGSGIAMISGMLATGIFLSNQMQAVQDALAKPASTVQPLAASSVQAATSVLSTASINWELGIFIMLAVLCFWLLRLLVRIFLSNLHLENDAAERVTMAKTYLALIRSNSLSKEDNINTVLAALFRPTGDGIVKDEGLPPSMMEFLTKLNK